MFNRFLVALLLWNLTACQAPPDPELPVVNEVSRASTLPQWSAKEVFALLPDSFFLALKDRFPNQFARLGDYSARLTLLKEHPAINENCMSQSLDTPEEKKRKETEYEESFLVPELQLCVYERHSDGFVMYLQVVQTCVGDCEHPKQEVLLGLCKQYDDDSQTWSDYAFPILEESDKEKKTKAPLYLLTPKGVCLRNAFETFSNTRHREANGQTDIARMVWESDACSVWTGKRFE